MRAQVFAQTHYRARLKHAEKTLIALHFRPILTQFDPHEALQTTSSLLNQSDYRDQPGGWFIGAA